MEPGDPPSSREGPRAGLGLRARAPPPDTGERARARDCPCSGRIIKLEKFEKGGNKTKIKGKPQPSLSPDPAPGTPGSAGGGWARAGMGVTVEVRQVYQYPFEQVVASFLRKVRARSGTPGPGGCAIDPAASAGRTWVCPGLQFLEAPPCRRRGRSVRSCTFASRAAAARCFSAVAGYLRLVLPPPGVLALNSCRLEIWGGWWVSPVSAPNSPLCFVLYKVGERAKATGERSPCRGPSRVQNPSTPYGSIPRPSRTDP